MSSHKEYWEPLASKNDLMEVAEDLGNYFKSKIRDKNNVPARYVSVQNVRYSSSGLGDLVEIQLEISYLSDQGEHIPSVLLKQFRTLELLDNEVERYSNIDAKCVRFPDIDVNPMISINRDLRYVVYEDPSGLTIDKISLPGDLANYMLGRVLGVIQGFDLKEVAESTIREFMIFMLMHMPFTSEEKVSIGDMMEPIFAQYSANTGRYRPVTSFSLENILITPRTSTISFDNIKDGSAFSIRIVMKDPENITRDRMADIAYLFKDMAMEEFLRTSTFDNTKIAVTQFMKGYSEVLDVLRIPPFEYMYPNGFPLDLQFIAVAWMDELQKVRTEPINPDNFEDREVLIYTYFLLTAKPFADFIDLY